jgi:aspartokinase-like uncharacterized kinase
MCQGRLIVLKVGGSLLDWPGLPIALSDVIDAREESRLLLVVGGGPIVETLRQLDRAHGLGEERSHALALRAMDLTAHLLASMVPGLLVVEAIGDLGPAWERRRIPVFAPRQFLDEEDRAAADPLPHRWEVTSDSIAARLADRLGASGLVLLKSTDAPEGIARQQAADLGLVDPYFPRASRSIPLVTIINLRDPDSPTTRLD